MHGSSAIPDARGRMPSSPPPSPGALPRGRTALRRRAAALLLASAAALPGALHAQWITDVEAGVLVNSNLGNAEAGPDVHAATAMTASVATGPFFELQPGTTATLAAQAKSTTFDRFTAEDSVALGLAARLDHKFGLGRQTPHASLAVTQTRQEVRDGLRSGWLQDIALGAREAFGDRLVLRGEIGTERRSGSAAAPVRPGLPGNVFDQRNRRLVLGADYSCSDRLLLQLDATLRRGDADYIETTTAADSFDGAGAVARDPTFGSSVFVERVQARALLIDAGASWALGDHASLNFIFRRQLTLDASGALYTRSIPTVNFQYRFD